VEPVRRYRVIDQERVVSYFGFQKRENFIAEYRRFVNAAISSAKSQGRDSRWSESVAVGNQGFLEGVRDKLGVTAKDRTIEEDAGISFLKEPVSAYGGVFGIENGALRGENSHF
jgi:putative transposase